MIQWTMSVEFFCLIVVIILILNFYDRRWAASGRSRLFLLCLWLSGATIALNIACVFTISQFHHLPLWVNLLLNSGYFAMVVGMSTVTAYYVLRLILEHVYSVRCLRILSTALGVLFLLYGVLLLVNLRTGLIFYFNEEGLYCRGPLVNVGYGVMGVELGLLIFCALKNRRSISQPMQRVMQILPPVVVLLAVYQILSPDVLFNGSIIVAADIILLLNFQSRRVEMDSLTCVGNRSSFYRELQLRLGGKQQFQVIAVCIRQFGTINQHYGQASGDALLYEAARWLDRAHRRGRAFRVGNVEFVLLAPYTGMVSAGKLLEDVCSRFRQSWVLGQERFSLDVRFAEIVCTDQDWSATDILDFLKFSIGQADQREDHLVRFDEALYQQMEQRRQTLLLMRRAVEEYRFEVWYQPVYRCAGGEFTSAEALLRLRDDQGELVPPSRFIPLAEETGILDQLSWIVLEDACRLLGSGEIPWIQSVSINLSAQQFISDELIGRVADCLHRYQLDPGRLKLEITERVLAEDMGRMHQVMDKLAALGVSFYLDDFGTGYSNLSGVLELPFDCVKLDHSLIAGYPDDERSSAVVDAMLELFHTMGCQVVAEGVETERQAQAVTAKGADWIQGYYYARPMPWEELKAFLPRKKKDLEEAVSSPNAD